MIPTSLSELGTLAIGGVSLTMLLTKATIILVVALGITLSMQRASAGARHLVWLVTLGTLLLVPALSAWAPLRLAVLPETPAVSGSTAGNGGARAPTDAVTRSGPAIDIGAPRVGAPRTDASVSTTHNGGVFSRLQRMNGTTLVVSLWAAVMLAIGASLAWAGFTLRRIVTQATPLDAPSWLTPLWEVSDRLGLEEPPRLLRSEEAKMPFACGMLTPTIVLPTECESWSLDRRHAVLLHELAHVRRHDLFGHTLGRLVCAVYWFHPLVWTAAKQLRSESERACDDLALACGTRATDYAEHLLDIVTSVRRDFTPSVALAMARRKEFEGRMLAILDPELRHSSPSRRQSAALIGSLALIAVVVGAGAPTARLASAASLYVPQQERTWPTTPETTATAPTTAKASAASGEHGAMSKSTSTSTSYATHEATRVQVNTQTSTAVNKALNTATDSFTATITNIATSAASAALNGLLPGARKSKGQQASDDRPLLLAKVLRTDTSATLRRIAAWGLSEYADSPVAADALANALRRDASSSVREMAGWALGHGDERSSAAIEALASALRSDGDERVRATSAWAMGNIGDRASVDALTTALADGSLSVRTRAAWALGNVEPRQAPKQLIALLSDKDTRMRELAAWALFRIEDPAAIPALEAALKTETNKDLQLDYIRALAALGERSVDALRGLLESPDPRVRSMAVRALAGGHAAGPWPWPWPEPRPFP
jgi:beta-lactamase regulating signal transducer with metallopeptidase domain/HEAT repeat protein